MTAIYPNANRVCYIVYNLICNYCFPHFHSDSVFSSYFLYFTWNMHFFPVW